MGTAERWAEFVERWNAWLSHPPSIRYLKMYEAVRLDGQFRSCSEAERNYKLHGCVDILKTLNPQLALQVSVNVADFERLAKDRMPPRLANPYLFAFWGMLSAACYELIDSGSAEPIEVIFDDHAIFRPRVEAWYPWFRDTIGDLHDPELASVLPPSMIFKDDAEFVPLQASDMLAWMFREAFSGNRNEFEWIAEELMPVIPMTKYSTFYDADRLSSVTLLGDEMSRRITPEHMERFKKIVGLKHMGKIKPRG